MTAPSEPSAYRDAIRRAVLRHSKLTRTAVAGVALVLPVACGNGDSTVFASAAPTVAVSSPAAVSATAPADVTTAAATAIPAIGTGGQTATGSSSVFADGAELVVSFTYQPSSDGQAKRPYIAVWVEDTEGNFVKTVSLWFEQGRKGTKWLDDLTQWYSASGGDATISGATRVPGVYTVAWDGTDLNGRPVVPGEYVLKIEAARERGPTSFTSGSISVGDTAAEVTIEDDEELSAISAALNT